MHAKSLQSCPTLWDPIDGSPPGSPVPGILQARTLEWVAISSSNAWKWKVKVKLLGRVQLLATPWTVAYQAPPFMGFSRQECWSGVPLPSPKRRHKDSKYAYECCISYGKCISSGKCKLKWQWDTTGHLLEWPKSGALTTLNTDKDVEQHKLFIAGRNVKWCSHFRRQCHKFLKKVSHKQTLKSPYKGYL